MRSAVQCPLCGEQVDQLVYKFHVENEDEVLSKIRTAHPDWIEQHGACTRCVDQYQIEIIDGSHHIAGIAPYFPVKSADDFVILPTSLRVDASPHFTGKGVTICIIDSGFYLHADLVGTANRIKAIVDITDQSNTIEYFAVPHPESWHGTMTSVVCAGDGYVSNGLYKGIASDASLVLLKVQTTNESSSDHGKITTQALAAALQWVKDNQNKYDIRIVNISVGDDHPASVASSIVSQLAEKLVADGVVVVAASGNNLDGVLKPPASAPSVITVGGLNDTNQLNENDFQLYHSTFGITAEGFQKPELIAPSIWVAAPILPGTPEKKEAEWLQQMELLKESEYLSFVMANRNILRKETGLNLDIMLEWAPFRNELATRIQITKFFSDNYMHVDGTSFAAPIVCSIIAQLLQANPTLSPIEIREVLFSTAKQLANVGAARQGYGIVQPRKALTRLLICKNLVLIDSSPVINFKENKISFYVKSMVAKQISLVGEFNNWQPNILMLGAINDHFWQAEMPLLPQGVYRYKFLIDSSNWVEDIFNPYREPDGYGGFNSILAIK